MTAYDKIGETKMVRRKMQQGSFFTVSEVAKMLKVSERQVRTWVETGELKVFRIGKRGYRIAESTLQEFIAERSKDKQE